MTLNVRDFGAAGDGVTKDTSAIQEAINRCSILGGGRVVMPAGRYLTGAIALRSDLILQLEENAIICGSPDANDYPVNQVRWEGHWIQGHIGLIYGIGIQNAAIVGSGQVLGADLLGGRPTRQNPLRHPALIEFIQCRCIHLEGFSSHYHHMWSIHPTYCEEVLIRGLKIRSTGTNGDGIDVDSCRHVHIDGCDISTGDDCISLKSGRGSEGYDLGRPTEDVLITNCTFADSNFACIGIGTELSSGIKDVRVEHSSCTHARSSPFFFKSRIGRGGTIENIFVKDFRATGMQGEFLHINLISEGVRDQYPVPGMDGVSLIRNVSFSNIQVSECPALVKALDIPSQKPVQNLTLSNVTGSCSRGLYLANMKGVKLHGLHLTGYEGPLVSAHNVTGEGIEDAASIPGPASHSLVTPYSPPYKLG